MTDSGYPLRESEPLRKTSCPDFEDLSRFMDGELDETHANEVGAHLQHCAWCSGLGNMIQAWFESAAAAADGRAPGSSCTTTEMLVGYLTTGLTDSERRSIDSHVRGCDQCVQTLTLLQRRLLSAPEMDVAVPAAVQERARAASQAGVRAPKPAIGLAEAWSTLTTVGRRLSTHIRLPVLVPAALAAGALFVVAGQQVWLNQGPPRELSRAVPTNQSLRITALEATVRSQPSSHSEIVATLSRGTVLTISGEEREWLHVSLNDGKEGWVERRAFE
jgi:Bacterial SH3 domain/Putative zinc-finger